MKRDRITDLHADNLHRDRAAIRCTIGGDRFHIWVIFTESAVTIQSDDGTPTGKQSLYCNSIADRGEPGWHDVRKLDATAAKNKSLVANMLVAGPRLIREERARAERRQRELDAAGIAARALAREAGPVLLAALEPLAMAARHQADALSKMAAIGGDTGTAYHLAAAQWRDLELAAMLAIAAARGETIGGGS